MILNHQKNKEAILAHQEGGVRRRDVRLIGTGSSIHKLDFEDELEKRILELGFSKDHPPSAILDFGIENLRQIAFQERFIFYRKYHMSHRPCDMGRKYYQIDLHISLSILIRANYYPLRVHL